jgi:hypothetical protein
MAQRFSPNTSVAEQILLNPTFANIDFADFQGLDMNLIDRNAEYTQNIANKRFEGMLDAQAKLLEEIKLHKKFDYLEKDLQNKLASVIDNAGNVQLSDNANFNKLNTNLISLKADPQLKRAVYSSEQAKKMQEILQTDPTLEKRLWDAPATINYKKFLNGETNDFELTPIYKNVDLSSFWYDEFFKGLPKTQQESLKKYGQYGLIQAKKEGYDIGDLQEKIDKFKNFTIKNNPEIVSHLERRGNYEATINPNLNKDQFIENYINESLNAAASKVAGVSNTISSVGMNPNQAGRMQQQSLDNAAGINSSQIPNVIKRQGYTLLDQKNKPLAQETQTAYENTLKKTASDALKNKALLDPSKLSADQSTLISLGTLDYGKTKLTINNDQSITASVAYKIDSESEDESATIVTQDVILYPKILDNVLKSIQPTSTNQATSNTPTVKLGI